MFDDPQAVASDFTNAWGEAMELFEKANRTPKLILPKNLQQYIEDKQEEFMEEDVRVGIIQMVSHTDTFFQIHLIF